MKIKKYKQGLEDKAIFGNLGSRITSTLVHKILGNAVVSKDGDIWYIAFDDNLETIGFGLVRKTKSKNTSYLKYLYEDENKKEVKKALIKQIIKDCKKEKNISVWTNERETEQIFKQF